LAATLNCAIEQYGDGERARRPLARGTRLGNDRRPPLAGWRMTKPELVDAISKANDRETRRNRERRRS